MRDLTGIKTILFDIGGTLLDFDQPESYAHLREGIALAHKYLRQHGIAHSLSRYRRTILWRFARAYLAARITRTEMNTLREIRRVHQRLSIDLDQTRFDDVCRLLYRPIINLAHAHPRTAESLAVLRDRGLQLGVISNTIAPPVGLDEHLAAEGLLEYLPVRVYSCEFGVPKPNPAIFREALSRMSANAPDTLYVGDKPRIDVRGAAAVGMRTALRIAPGTTRRRGPTADLEIRQIADLLEHLPSYVTS